MQPFLDSSTNADSPIQPTDIQLLTTSILSNQERQRVILFYQEQLIDTQPSLPDLKKALLFLSASSWGQILEERKLAGKCAYPPCPHASPSLTATRGKFRIDLRTHSVRALDELDLSAPGHTYDELRDFFCARPCYARAEWVLRWVLAGSEALVDESAKGEGVLGGKWHKLTSRAGEWESVELLEDLESVHGVDLQGERGMDGAVLDASVAAQSGAHSPRVQAATKDVRGVTNLLGDLTVIERSKSTTTPPAPPAAASSATQPVPSRTPYTVDVPNTLGQRFHPTTASSNPAPEPDLETDLEAHERELSHILRYASLATGSRPPRTRNPTAIQLATSPSPAATAAEAGELANSTAPAEQDADTDDEPTIDPQAAAERAEMRRVMDLALDVRRQQREQGLLD
ncbi:conserved hypothetical protein [Sporisorium reilianum SRZ2]|uniref:RNA polymerase II subunit B1 CTD phosphatase RPAP2 homolog n=1 Tax=Sporisorium reilianum (strain SRZ2) TaxID=999809 RepID=E7A1J5_SPORE|nr:conserved hypothetical protein [Sporisorium reilianum SRZ2]